jgi:hypothetical protein
MPDMTTFHIKIGKGQQPRKANLQGPPPYPDPPGTEDGARWAAVVVAKHMHNDRQKKVTQQLFGNGVARGTIATAAFMRKAHPQHDAPLVLPVPHGPQESVTTDTARKLLVKKAGSKENSVGFFGWAGDYLFRSPVDVLNESNAFLTQVARFTALMASGEAPESLPFFTTVGPINALNKLNAKENDVLIAAGKDVKDRPINSGYTFRKYVVKVLTETPSSLKIKRSMKHLNLGMGTPGGSEKIANILQMVYKKGGTVAKEDATDAFNTLKRQHMRIQQDKVLLETTKILNFFYDDRSIVLYSHKDEMGVDRTLSSSVKRDLVWGALPAPSYSALPYSRCMKPSAWNSQT